MAVKNYLISARHRIKSSNWVWKDTSRDGDVHAIYTQMYDESRKSFSWFLAGEWEPLLYETEINHINDFMPLSWKWIKELWESEPCNILWAGSDVQVIKPVEIFDQYDDFRLFNWTDPKSWNRPDYYNLTFDNFFNNDLRYYPHTMSKEIWDIGQEVADKWVIDGSDISYNTEQIIHNKMFWSQGLSFEQAHKPEMFYQAFMMPQNDGDAWNNCAWDDARIIHWHSSRNPQQRLDIMRSINQQIESQLNEV